MIREVTYKASIQADGGIFNEGIEMRVENDSMPLSPGQLEEANDRVTQIRSNILSLRRKWEESPKENQPAPAKISTATAPKADEIAPCPYSPPEATPMTLAKTSNAAIAPKQAAFGVVCSVCGEITEPQTSKKGVRYEYCPKCKDNRTAKGHPFPERVA